VEEESRAVTVGACELRTIEELGSGHFGEVSRVLHPRANVSLALKRINLERANSNCKQLARSF
jgi:serine/threonine protein kinase